MFHSELVEVLDGGAGREIVIIDIWLLGRSWSRRCFGLPVIRIDRLDDGTDEGTTGLMADGSYTHCMSNLADLLCDSQNTSLRLFEEETTY